MSLKYRVTGEQYFTSRGIWGAILFVACPVVSPFLYSFWMYRIANPYEGSPILPALVVGAVSILFFASIPMMLIGRGCDYKVDEIVKQAKPNDR